MNVRAGRPKNDSRAPPFPACWSIKIVIAAFVCSHCARTAGVKPWFLSTIVTGPRKWWFFIHFATSRLFCTRATAIIGRANERMFVAASQTP